MTSSEENADGLARLPLQQKLAFAAPGFASAGLALPIYAFMPKFYTDVALAPLGFVAVVIAVARAFDAITDPTMGWLSDRSRTRWGRRRPWILLGAPLTALSVIALFTPPAGLDPSGAALWFGATFTLYFLFHTMYWVPYSALGFELTPDYNERSSVFGWREGSALLGTFVASLTPWFVDDIVGDEHEGYFLVGIFFAVLLVVLFGWLVLSIRERPDFVARESNPLIPGIRRSLRNGPFRILLLAYVISALSAAIPATIAPYFLEYVLKPERYGLWLTLSIGSFVFAGVASIPAWIWLARKIGKRGAWFVQIFVGISGNLPIFLLGEGQELAFTLLLLYAGTNMGANLIHPAMQADVIDYDELHSGKRREAQYASLWSIVPKFVAIPSAAVPLSVLALVGYAPNQPQTEEVQLALRIILGIVPPATLLISLFFALRYPITENIHRAILDGITLHQRGENATDPVTGTTIAPPAKRLVGEELSWFMDYFSTAELARIERTGPRNLPRNIGLRAVGYLLPTLALSAWISNQIDDLANEPSGLITFAIVAAGWLLTLTVFHALRLPAALKMRRHPLDRQLLSDHIAGAASDSR